MLGDEKLTLPAQNKKIFRREPVDFDFRSLFSIGYAFLNLFVRLLLLLLAAIFNSLFGFTLSWSFFASFLWPGTIAPNGIATFLPTTEYIRYFTFAQYTLCSVFSWTWNSFF